MSMFQNSFRFAFFVPKVCAGRIATLGGGGEEASASFHSPGFLVFARRFRAAPPTERLEEAKLLSRKLAR